MNTRLSSGNLPEVQLVDAISLLPCQQRQTSFSERDMRKLDILGYNTIRQSPIVLPYLSVISVSESVGQWEGANIHITPVISAKDSLKPI